MKKTFISLSTIAAMIFSSGAHADTDTPSLQTEITPAETAVDVPLASVDYGEVPVEQEKEVGKASTEGAKAARSKHWQNITLAVAAVAVAVTALVVVSNNNGHGK